MPAPKKGRPRIAVTGPDRGGWPSWACTCVLLWCQGGRAVRVTPSRPSDLADCEGLVLGGGADVAPERYQQKILNSIRQERQRRRRVSFRFSVGIFLWLARKLFSVSFTVHAQDLRRDALEFGLIDTAFRRGLPILGICRGAQLLNVYLGGTLYQDIHGFYQEQPQLRTILARKRIDLVRGTHLFRIFRTRHAKVNSLHRQSVKELGRDLRIAAMEPNGVVQAVECVRCPFILGVQWHPEFLPLHRQQRRIFRHLVSAAHATRVISAENLPPAFQSVRAAPAARRLSSTHPDF